MNEQTNPQPGVSQERSIEDRMEAYLSQSQDQGQGAEDDQSEAQPSPPQRQAQTAEQPNDQVPSDELTAEDLPEDSAQESQGQSGVDAFEIVHNGQQVKLSRAEVIQHAQQGFDYTRKVQAVAEKDRQATETLRQISEIQQITPYLMQERAQVVAIEQQLAQWQNVNWVQVARDDPMGYPEKRAQYDVLLQAYQHARGQYDQKEHFVRQKLDAFKQERRKVEEARIPELIPDWADAKKREAGEAELARHIEATYGIGREEQALHLTGAIPLAVAYKAMRYDQLLKSKSEKVKQLRTAPPVTKPGAAQTNTAKADRDVQLRQNLKKSGTREDAVAVYLNRMK